MIRVIVLAIASAALAPAWTESVEFPWNTFPQHLQERELVWLKNIGIRHVSLPSAGDPARLRELISIIRRLNLEADLEGPVPEELQPFTRAHGGPLTDPLPKDTVRIEALASGTLNRERHALDAHAPAVLWTDVEDTIGANGFKPGVVSFTGQEKPATVPLRRAAQLSRYWGDEFARMTVERGAALQIAPGSKPPSGVSAIEFSSPRGASAVSFINDSSADWHGDFRAIEHGGKPLMISGLAVPGHGALMIPVHVPLVSGPLCSGCSGLAPSDYLVYSTAELTAIEYENGILAMEFSAPFAGEAVLQLDREPVGPLVAGGKPSPFDWDEHTMRVRVPIPAGKEPGNHVRVGLAIEPPDHTAYFENARVLLIGEVNRLIAQFSSREIAARSRLRIVPELPVREAAPPPSGTTPADGPEPVRFTYEINVPNTAIHGDQAELILEADAIQMSHVRPQLLRPVSVHFPDSIGVRLPDASSYPLYPPVMSVNARSGREMSVSVRNNAPEIRTFKLSIAADGVDFSPATSEVSIGASTSRDVSFHVFAAGASAGIHEGAITISGAASAREQFRLVVIPASGDIAWTADGFYFLENALVRAAFMPGSWLEYFAKEQGEERLPKPVASFFAGPVTIAGNALTFGDGRTIHVADLERLAPKHAPAEKRTPAAAHPQVETRPRP